LISMVIVTVTSWPSTAAISPIKSTQSNQELCDGTPISERALPDVNRPVHAVDLTIDPKTGSVTGTMISEFTAEQDLDRVVFRLWPNGGIRDSLAPSLAVSDVRVSDVRTGTAPSTPPRVERSDPTTLNIRTNASVGQRVRVAMSIKLVVPGERNDRVSVTRRSGQVLAARYGAFLPTFAWEPGVGWNRTPPTRSGAEASMAIAADWRVRVGFSTATDLRVIASGIETEPGVWTSVSERDWAMSVGSFPEASRIVRSTVSVGVGTPVSVTVAIAAPLQDSASLYRSRVIAAIRDLSRRYGPYPYSTYTLVLTPGLRGGIEFPSHVMQGPASSGRSTPHEVAHQWFYGLVGNDQGRDPWIDEGLATWAETRTEGTLSAFRTKSIPAAGKQRAGESMTYWDVNRSAYYRGVYVQTTQGLARLENPERVDCALRDLAARYAHQIVTADEVIAHLEQWFPGEGAAALARVGIR
jgi:hypothetical protein